MFDFLVERRSRPKRNDLGLKSIAPRAHVGEQIGPAYGGMRLDAEQPHGRTTIRAVGADKPVDPLAVGL
jgi:hypothetical protein